MMNNISDNLEAISQMGDPPVFHAHMEPWAYTFTAVILFCIGFFGFFLNLFVIVLMCKDIQVSSFDYIDIFCNYYAHLSFLPLKYWHLETFLIYDKFAGFIT